MCDVLKLLFLGRLYSESQKQEFFVNSKKGYQFAAQFFQEALLDGFIINGIRPYVLTEPPLSTFPFGYKKPCVKTVDFMFQNQVLGTSVGFLNLPFIKSISALKLRKEATKWCSLQSEKKYVLVYGLYPPLMALAIRIKQQFGNVKIGVVVPDLHQFMGCNKFYKRLGLQQKDIAAINRMIPCFDCYVVLTEGMLKVMGVEKKPHVIVEGIYSNQNKDSSYILQNKGEKIILYTGGLFIRYGVKDLIEAFMKIEEDTYKLWLCGTGDAVDYIRKSSMMDNRIVYKGLLPKKDIIRLQQEATLLVNPRHSNEEFTMYSFPSKTMEYMASGTPVVMAPLKCLPKEYDKYLFFFEDESVEGMAKTLKTICEMDSDELRNKGSLASQFVRNQKNAKCQSNKIVNLLASL